MSDPDDTAADVLRSLAAGGCPRRVSAALLLLLLADDDGSDEGRNDAANDVGRFFASAPAQR